MKINTYLMKSNKNNIFIPLCLAAFALVAILAACDRNEAEAEQRTDGPETAYLELDQIGVEGNVLSRATPATTDVPTTGTIGFFRRNTNGYEVVNNNKGVWKLSAVTKKNAWIPDPMIKVGTTDATIAIYYPYVETNTSVLFLTAGQLGTVIDGKTVQETWCKRFTYNSLSSYGDNKVSIELKHVYSKLKITLKRGTGFIGTPDWTKVKLTGAGICQRANFYPLDKDAPELTSYNRVVGPLDLTLSPTITFDKDSSTPVELLLIPYGFADDITITITLGGKEMDVKIPNASFDGQFAPGKQYNLTITVNPTDLEVASLKTTDWTYVNLTGQSTH